MKTKILEVRDRMTYIPVIAVEINYNAACEPERYMFRRQGYDPTRRYIIITKLQASGNAAHYDPNGWGQNRTMKVAHNFIQEAWDEIETGYVVDVEYILGETGKPKRSERLDTQEWLKTEQ